MIAWYGLSIGLKAAMWPEGEGRGLLWLPEGQYLCHTTTSNH